MADEQNWSFGGMRPLPISDLRKVPIRQGAVMAALLAVASFTLSSGRNGLRALSYALKERPSHASISHATAGLVLMSARGGGATARKADIAPDRDLQ